MKRILMAATVMALLLSFTACGGSFRSESEAGNAALSTKGASEPGISSPYDSAQYRGRNVSQVESDLKGSGFQIIEMIAIEDLTSSGPIADGTVESVTIDGMEEFDKSILFPEDAAVKIRFHRIPKLKAPLSSKEASAVNYMEVGERYFNAGFTNIHTREMYDLEPGTQSRTEVTFGKNAVSEKIDIPFDGEINIIGHYPRAQYSVKINIDFVGNWIFSKYDVDIMLEDKKFGQLPHGEDGSFDLKLEEGRYKLIFAKSGKGEVKGETTLDIHSDSVLNFIISTNSDEISVQIDSENRKLKSGQIKLPFSDKHYLRMDVKQAVSELRELGFTNITTLESHENVWGYSAPNSVTSIALDGRKQFEHDEIVSQTANIEVCYHVCDFMFQKNEVTVTEKETFTIPYTLTSGDPLDSINFIIDDEQVVRQNPEGGFDALTPGRTTITALSGGKVCSICNISVEEMIIPIEELTLSVTEINAAVGSYFDLQYTCKPENSDDTDIVVAFSDDIVEECEKGKYYVAEEGDCEITYSRDNKVLAVCKVHAEVVDITAINLNEEPSEIVIGEDGEIPFTLEPENATNKGIKVISSDPEILAVCFQERGESKVDIRGLKAGRADVIITVPNGAEYKKTVEVKEVIPTELQIMQKNSETVLRIGTPLELELKWVPEETSMKEVTWESSNPGVIKVDQAGVIEAIGIGRATIKAKHRSGVSGILELEVQPTTIESIEISTDYQEQKFVKGNQMTLIAEVYPENATDQTIAWFSSDPSVATVNERGIVTAVGEGSAAITAKSKNGIFDVYPVQVGPVPQKYAITWSLTMVSNDHVGKNWSRGCEINGEACHSGATMTFNPDEEIWVSVWVQEDDSRPDNGAYNDKIQLTEEIRKYGFVQEGEIYVRENGGRYSGHEAVWNFRFSLQPVSW